MAVDIIVDWERLPQIRIDPLTGKSVIVSAKRAQRTKKSDNCPFCPGNEDETPKALVVIPDPSNPQEWATRGFSNLFPPLMIEDGGDNNNVSHFFKQYVRKGIGASEVIVESPKHDACLSELTELEIAAIFWALAGRYFDLKKDPRFAYFYAFKTNGDGASQKHPHWQDEAREFAPTLIHDKCQIMSEYEANQRECLLCRICQEEKRSGLVVTETDHFVAYVPFAPTEPYAIQIAPREHSSCFAYYLQDKDITLEFARVLREAVVKVRKVVQGERWEGLPAPNYLFCLYTAPYGDDVNSYYHWHVDLLPRTTHKVGHERGTGEDIIPVFPEEAAETLRNA